MQAASPKNRRLGYVLIVIVALVVAAVAIIETPVSHSTTPSSSEVTSTSNSTLSSTSLSTVSSATSSTSVSTSSTSSISSTAPPTTSTTFTTSSSTTSTTMVVSTTTSSSSSSSSTTSSVQGNYWTTYHGSNARDGSEEYGQNVSSLSVNWKASVDGGVYAEPLSLNQSVFVATENNTVYSISATSGAIQWSTHLGTPINSTAPPYTCNGASGPDITPTVGITGTPVIDVAAGTIFVTALINGSGYSLYAINLTTGSVQWSAPISPSGFTTVAEEQRGALALANGFVYIPFGGFSFDCTVPYGWLVAVAANGNGTVYSYEVPSQNEADIWEPEGVTVAPSGDLFVATGNSYYNATYNYADSVLEFTPRLQLVSSFAPTNWAYLGPEDLDQDTTGVTTLPGGLLFSIGKSGVGYILNSSQLGGIGGQVYDAPVCDSAWGSTAYANGIIYVPCADGLHALSLTEGTHPSFTSLWNATGFFAGPPIVAYGAVWTFDIYNGTLFALNPTTGVEITSISPGGIGSVEHFTTSSVVDNDIVFAADETIYSLSV